MPQSTVVVPRILEMLPRRLSAAELAEVLWSSKAELTATDGEEARVECTADRLDLLCEGGLGLYLQGVLAGPQGLPPLPERPPAHPISVHVDASVASLRPAIAAAVVSPPEGTRLDGGLLTEAVRFQELLHGTVGAQRRIASLGIYPLHRIRPPIGYSLEPLSSIQFTPLEAAAEMGGREFFDGHPMAATYGGLGRSGDACLVLRDSGGTILSLPPVLNSREAGEAKIGDGALLLESTGLREPRVLDAVGLLAMVFAARGWTVAPVAVHRGHQVDDGRRVTSSRTVGLPREVLVRLAGRVIPPAEVEDGLRQARLGPSSSEGGWSVAVPPWRPDLQTATDVAEDLLLIRGVRSEDGVMAPSSTRGGRSEASTFRDEFAGRLLGLSYVPLYTPVLVSARQVGLVGRSSAIELANPVSDQYAFLRDSLLPSLVGTLERNRRHAYPQRFSEVGPIVVRSEGSETGSETRYHAGAFLAGEGAGFADAASLVDYLMRSAGAVGVREPVEIPGLIPGRAARVRLAGEAVGELGELDPAVLGELGVPVPVAWAEIDLTSLAPLLGRRAIGRG